MCVSRLLQRCVPVSVGGGGEEGFTVNFQKDCSSNPSPLLSEPTPSRALPARSRALPGDWSLPGQVPSRRAGRALGPCGRGGAGLGAGARSLRSLENTEPGARCPRAPSLPGGRETGRAGRGHGPARPRDPLSFPSEPPRGPVAGAAAARRRRRRRSHPGPAAPAEQWAQVSGGPAASAPRPALFPRRRRRPSELNGSGQLCADTARLCSLRVPASPGPLGLARAPHPRRAARTPRPREVRGAPGGCPRDRPRPMDLTGGRPPSLSNSAPAQDPGQPHPRPQRTDSGPQTGLAGPGKVASASAAASTLSETPRRTQESQTRTRAPGLSMEKSAASTEPQGPRPVLGRDSVQVPDDQDFRSFRSECEAEAGWNLTYSKAGVSVWVQAVEMDRTLHKIKVGLGTAHAASPPRTGVSWCTRRAPAAWLCISVSCQELGRGTVCPASPITQMSQLRPGEGV